MNAQRFKCTPLGCAHAARVIGRVGWARFAVDACVAPARGCSAHHTRLPPASSCPSSSFPSSTRLVLLLYTRWTDRSTEIILWKCLSMREKSWRKRRPCWRLRRRDTECDKSRQSLRNSRHIITPPIALVVSHALMLPPPIPPQCPPHPPPSPLLQNRARRCERRSPISSPACRPNPQQQRPRWLTPAAAAAATATATATAVSRQP